MASTGSEHSSDKPTVFCVFCASSPGLNPAHLESARALAHEMHRNNIKLVYGGGTRGIMGELAKTLVSLSGPDAVHGVIPQALIRVDEGFKGTSVSGEGATPSSTTENNVEQGKAAERVMDKKELGADSGSSFGSGSGSGSGSPSSRIVQLPAGEYGRTTIVPDMHTRKRLMAADVLSGGPGSGFVALAGGYGTLEEVAEMITWNQLGIHQSGIVLVNIDGYWDGIVEWVGRSVKEGFVGEGNQDIVVEVKRVEGVVEALRGYTLAKGTFKLDWSQG